MKTIRVVAGVIVSLLVVTLASAALLSQYVSITGTVTILPHEDTNTPNHIADCFFEGWKVFTRLDGSSFENQGRCVSYVATNMCKDGSWELLVRADGSSFTNQGQCVSYFSRASPDVAEQDLHRDAESDEEYGSPEDSHEERDAQDSEPLV